MLSLFKTVCGISIALQASGAFGVDKASSAPPHVSAAVRALATLGSGTALVDLGIENGVPLQSVVIERARAVGDGNNTFSGQPDEWDLNTGNLSIPLYWQGVTTWQALVLLQPRNSQRAVGILRAKNSTNNQATLATFVVPFP